MNFTYNYLHIWYITIYNKCLSDRGVCAVAMLMEARLTDGNAVVLFLVLCCYLGGNGGIKLHRVSRERHGRGGQRRAVETENVHIHPVSMC